MNTGLLKECCGINVAESEKRTLRLESMRLTDAQIARLKDNYPKGTNHALITKIEAFRLMRKRQWTGVVKVLWWLTPTIAAEAYCNEERFKALSC